MSQPLESYQDEIYLTGLTGTVPEFPDRPRPAGRGGPRGAMTPRAYDYVAGAAGSGDTARENLEAFRRWRIVPRMLTDVSTPSYASTLLGTELTVPFLLAPVGVLRDRPPGRRARGGRAAAAAGVPMILSTAASTAMEDVAEANGDGQRWYQLYWPKDRAVGGEPAGPRPGRRLHRAGRHPGHPDAWPGGRATWPTATCPSCRASESRTTCPTRRSRPGWPSPVDEDPDCGDPAVDADLRRHRR